jgi:response regulator RpfG family c-di-GMP phosphodiesterase
MKLAQPIYICSFSQDFRSLIREMLTKHGFFHFVEISSASELMALGQKEKKDSFIILQKHLLNRAVQEWIHKKKNFIIIAQPEEDDILQVTSALGVERFLSFPFSSQVLLEKISQFL